jgi:serine/threonine protein kinase
MSRFYICEFEGIRFLTKLCFYRKTPPEIYGKVSKNVVAHIDAEINILKIFRDRLLRKNITPCILELVYEKVCENLDKIVPKEKICERLMLDYRDTIPEDDVEQLLCKYDDLVKNGLAHNKCAFLVLEKCDMSLDDYLRKSINTPVSMAVFKSLLFQIIYTMYAIKQIYPGFRHYDLHTDNIMLKFDSNYKFKATNPKFLVFHIDGEQYSVPYFGIFAKIIDFGFSSLPEENIVSNATDDRIQMYFRSDNDLLFLFHFIHYTLSHTGGDKLGRVDKLLSSLEPNRSYVQHYTEHIRRIAHKIPTYEQMVKNKVFDEYTKYKPIKSQIYNEFTPVDDQNE